MRIRPGNTLLLLIPFAGICLFVFFYLVASLLYPGGSHRFESARAFSWIHNYWCDLLDTKAKNGLQNPARPVAILALMVLSSSLICFWYYFTVIYNSNGRLVIRFSGILSAVLMIFLFIGPHDLVINLSSTLGLIAITGALLTLFRERLYTFFWLGLFCLALCVINDYIYLTGNFLNALPVIQKISFFIFLLWFCLLDIQIYKKASGLETLSRSQ